MCLCFQTRSIHLNKVEYVARQTEQKLPHGEPSASGQYKAQYYTYEQLGSSSLYVIMVLDSLRSTLVMSTKLQSISL